MSMKKTKSLEELNPRWLSFIDDYLKTGNAFQSALTVGFSEEYAKVITSRFPEPVRISLKDALDHKGITPDKIAEKVNVLLDAKKKVRTFIKGDLETEYEEEDSTAIDKGLTHAIKIRGDYAPEKTENKTVTVNINLSDKKVKEINKLALNDE